MKMKITLWLWGVLLPVFLKAQTTTLTVSGRTRTMFVHAPAGIAQNRPLVISMHGLNQDINYQKNQAKWELVADTAKFVVVYPAGENNSWDIGGTKDTDFILAIIESMVTRYGIDRSRVYVSGFSMGGMMSYHTANRLADKIAAIGPVSGYLFGNPVSSSRPMPIIHVHGTADDVVRYEQNGNQPGILAILQKWRSWNKCPSNATLIDPYPSNKPNSGASWQSWGPCDNSAVALISLRGKGHWHSNDPAGVHTTSEIWNFVKKYSLNTGQPIVSLQSPTANASFVAPASVAINASASDPNGSIANVKFYQGNTLLTTDNTSPFSYTWTNVAAGTYTIRAVATDNQGNTAEASTTIKVHPAQGPYEGTAHAIPGRIQAEHFDVGGNGNAYLDNTPGSSVSPIVNFRADEDVDIENCTDAGGGYNIGFATAGEWLEYTVEVQSSGKYDLALRVACNGTGRTLSATVDGTSIASNVSIPNTGGWQNWQTVTVNNVELSVGKQVLRITFGQVDYINLNYIDFSKAIVAGWEEKESIPTVIAHPNPFENKLKLRYPHAFSYKLYDLAGNMVLQGEGMDEVSLGDDLKSGSYLLQLVTSETSHTMKVCKK